MATGKRSSWYPHLRVPSPQNSYCSSSRYRNGLRLPESKAKGMAGGDVELSSSKSSPFTTGGSLRYTNFCIARGEKEGLDLEGEGVWVSTREV